MVKVSITKMPLRKSQVINILRQFIRKIFQNKLNRLKEKINEDEEGGEEIRKMMALAKEGVLPKIMKTLLMMILMQIIQYLKILQA
jgi:hypothetical protein